MTADSLTPAMDLALVGLVLWLCVRGPLLVAARPRDALAFLLVVAGALAVQLQVPPGPLDFAESGRLQALWVDGDFVLEPEFSAVVRALCGLRDLGISWVTLVRWAGPLLSAVGVGLVYACGRAGGLDTASSLLGSLVLLAWPAHLRYGVSSLAMAGPTVWTGVFAAALSRAIPPTWKVLLVALGTFVGVHCRPELALLVVPLVPLVFSDGWRWRDRLVLAALLALGLGHHAIALLHHRASHAGYPWIEFARWLFHDPAINPGWWIVAAILGLFVGRVRLPLRLALALAVGLLATAYVRFASEENPLWSVWRTVVAITPFAALAAAALVNRLPAGLARRVGAAALAAATVVAAWRYAPIVLRPLDGQTEYAYLRESAARIARQHPDLVVITTADLAVEDFAIEGMTGVPVESNVRQALAAALDRADPPVRCRTSARLDPPRLWALDVLSGACPGRLEAADVAIYLGLFRPPRLLAQLQGRYRLEPIEERHVSAAPALQFVDTACPYPIGTLIGSRLPDCALTLGWYRPVPR